MGYRDDGTRSMEQAFERARETRRRERLKLDVPNVRELLELDHYVTLDGLVRGDLPRWWHEYAAGRKGNVRAMLEVLALHGWPDARVRRNVVDHYFLEAARDGVTYGRAEQRARYVLGERHGGGYEARRGRTHITVHRHHDDGLEAQMRQCAEAWSLMERMMAAEVDDE